MILDDTSEKAIVAGAKAGAGAVEVVLVRDTAERDLSRNSTTDYGQDDMRMIKCLAWATRTLVSVIALYRLSISGPNVFWSGTTRVGTVAVDKICYHFNFNMWEDVPFGFRRRNEGEKFSPVEKAIEF